MNKHTTRTTLLVRAIATGALASLAAGSPGLAAQPSVSSTPAYVSQPQATAPIQIRRASHVLGTDVMSADGRKVGAVSDLVFDLTQPPRLSYILVTMGGLLGVGGETRAVPAAALTLRSDNATLQLTGDQYTAVPKIAGDRIEYLSNPEVGAQLHSQFRVNPPPATGTGRHPIALFTELNKQDVYSVQSGHLGFINDAWISVNQERAPFIEITPMINPFELPGDQRFALPLARLEDASDKERLAFSVSADELRTAPTVSDVPGVDVVNNGFAGNTVLRIAPGVATAQPRRSTGTVAAGSPTGFEPATQGATAAAVGAAQQIRLALDNDASLRQADVQVTAQGDRVVLRGSVNNDALRQWAQQAAEKAAPGARIDNQITAGER